ncbi:MAG TPA: ABC transporter ATP-binding protein [Candidatus Dormibacteraeota bacterium]|nr:ABC transporter ATP-binding protein [Candidatus Dormibacteraeota bacterium]
MTAALEVQALGSSYGKSRVVAGVSLEVASGEIAVLLGRNGAGKTTTLRAIAGVQPADAGKVALDGEDLSGFSAYRRVRRGLVLVPSGARAFGPLTVAQNLHLVRGRAAGDGRWTVEAVYDFFPKLRQLKDNASGLLSGGERQMLAVGRALMANPRVIMLDEPSEGLAPIIVQSIGELLLRLRDAGLAVFLAEQNHHMAMRVADNCHFIEKGRIVASASAPEAREQGLLERHLGV